MKAGRVNQTFSNGFSLNKFTWDQYFRNMNAHKMEFRVKNKIHVLNAQLKKYYSTK